ncbi:hypothetical protein [Paraburkholderia phytofirmans]|jgi:hypothetical protein|uniref:hypothetical protein n=1 Tax=Paraburkholderia phytofirmans TaxID=261302 RepID=UPI0038BB56F6
MSVVQSPDAVADLNGPQCQDPDVSERGAARLLHESGISVASLSALDAFLVKAENLHMLRMTSI